jgi:hypothetical protein
MEIRVGDKIETTRAATVVKVGSMHSMDHITVRFIDGGEAVISPSDVTKITARKETNAEKIARLERRVVELEGLVDVILPDAPINRLADHDGLSKQTYDVRVGDAQQSEYDKQPPCAELVTGLSRFERNMKTMFGPKTESPWYPPQLEGYGPWTEGTPPEDFTGTAQLLMKSERNCETYCEGAYVLERGFVLGCDYVAYCVKL